MLAPETRVYCYCKDGNLDKQKIYLPSGLLKHATQWYHIYLCHPGSVRLTETMKLHLYNPKIMATAEKVVSTCDTCQRFKLVGRGHGHTAPKEAPLTPWSDIAVDCIGPWLLKCGEQELKFHALTTIDLVTNLVEISRLENLTAAHVALQFENQWLSRYPKPNSVIFDQGREFMGEFQSVLMYNRIEARPISAKNPQANAICERMHQTIGNSLRVISASRPPRGVDDAKQMVDTAIANAVHAHRSTFHGTINATPGSLAFHRDMILDLPLIADLQLIREHRQQLIDRNLITANRRRFAYDYQVGEQVLKLIVNPNKLDPRAIGPFTIARVHTNGTVSIRLDAHTVERISIRRIKPYRQPVNEE